MGTTGPELVDRAAALRLGLLRYHRGPNAYTMTAAMLREGEQFAMPAQWRELCVEEQAERLVSAEVRRVSDARLFALAAPVVEAVRAVADQPIALPLLPAVLPAPSGMIVFAQPVSVTQSGAVVTAATWGPLPGDSAEGVHLTWWSDRRAAAGRAGSATGTGSEPGTEDLLRAIPLLHEYGLPVHFVPVIDQRLYASGPDGVTGTAHAPALRAIVAAWYALSEKLVPTRELRADPVTGRALAAEKARHRGVQYGTATDVRALADGVVQAAAKVEAKVREDHPEVVGELSSLVRATTMPLSGLDEVFAPDRDLELPTASRWLPRLYRSAAQSLQQLEASCEESYPGVFDALEEQRARTFGSWPQWCWMPVARVAAQLVSAFRAAMSTELVADATVIAALGAWRAGGRHALAMTHIPVVDAVPPRELPDRLPVPAATLIHINADLSYSGGLLAFLEAGPDHRPELRFLDYHTLGPRLRTCHDWQLVLSGDTAQEAAAATARIALHPAGEDGRPMTDAEVAGDISNVFAPYLPALNLLAAPAPVSPLQDVAGVLQRRPARHGPPPAGWAPHMTMWISPLVEEAPDAE
ncbi:hypothetical protein AB0B15_11590 [Streptomyces sp. NPDC045456]|uniref:hypothetical protein n=1 Tax=Streptomyces sp. NPDC045456 TaxID=3155254 RepID=UPI0033F2F26C